MIFRNWVLQNFPFLEDDFDALTDYELFCKMVEYMRKSLDKIKDFQKDIDAFTVKLNEFQHYFDNLDLQEEVDNKLQEMYEDGSLENLISQYLELQTTYTFNSISEMKEATNLVNGSFAKTTGFYSNNDGGGAYYKIRTILNTDTIDEMFLIALDDENLVAELMIVNNELNVKQIGVKGIISSNDTDAIKEACSKECDVYFPSGTYLLDEQLVISNVSNKVIRGDGINKTIIKIDEEQTGEHTSYIATSSLENDIVNFTFKDMTIDCDDQNINRYGISFLTVNGLNIENVEIKNNKGYATRFNDSENVYVNNLYIHDCYEPVEADGVAGGLYAQNIKNLQVNNSRIINCGDHAFYLTGDIATSGTTYAENIQLNNVYCKAIGTDGYTAGGAITIYGNIKNVQLNNCIVEDSLESIHISNHGAGLVTPKDITISNCVLKNSVNTGLFIQGITTDPVSFISVINTIIDGVDNNDGISLRYCDSINLNSNIIKNAKRIGLEIINTDNSIVNNNNFINNKAQIYCGTRSSTYSRNNTISNNNIYTTDAFNTDNPTNEGVYIANVATNTLLLNNNAYNHMQYNFLVLGSTNKSMLQSMNNRDINYKRNIMYNNAAPSANIDAQVGDICLNINPTAGGTIGWVCVTAGSPGTWKAFGTIAS